MSVAEIPTEIYEAIFNDAVARYTKSGLDLIAAKQMASAIMKHCFVPRWYQEQCDTQKDYDEARETGDWVP